MTRSMVCALLKSISIQSGHTESVASFHTPPALKLSPARSPLLMADTGKEPLKVLEAKATAPAEERATLTLAPALYTPRTLWVAPFRPLVVQVAVRILPVPVTAAVAQPVIEVAPSLKFTVPVGPLPLTVAVRVTLLPAVEGVNELPSAVVLVR